MYCPQLINEENDKRCGKATFALAKTIYGNAVTHLKSCYGGCENLDEIVKALRKERGCKVKKTLADILGMKLTPMERSLLAFIELAVLELIPFSKFQSTTFRKHLNVEPVSVEVIQDTMILLMFIVEDKIKKEMARKKGCIIHDGFSRFGTHYFGVIAQYMNYSKNEGKYEVVHVYWVQDHWGILKMRKIRM